MTREGIGAGQPSASPILLWIALLAGLLPVVGIHGSYIVAAATESVPACIPYFHGCSSISATGRHPPASFVFRGTMIPAAIAMFAYWYLARRWLGLHGDDSLFARLLPWIGFLAMLFMIVYTAVLGHIGEWVAIARRISVVSYLAINFLGQLFLVHRIQHLTDAGRLSLPPWILRVKLTLCTAMLLVGLLVIPVSIFIDDSRVIDNVIEWNYSLLLVCYFPITAAAWYVDRFRFSMAVRD